MNIQAGTIEITGLHPEILRKLDDQAKEAGYRPEDLVRMLIEQEYTQPQFAPEQLETLRQEVAAAGEQIRQGNYFSYDSVDEMMDEIEAGLQERLAKKQNGTAQ